MWIAKVVIIDWFDAKIQIPKRRCGTSSQNKDELNNADLLINLSIWIQSDEHQNLWAYLYFGTAYFEIKQLGSMFDVDNIFFWQLSFSLAGFVQNRLVWNHSHTPFSPLLLCARAFSILISSSCHAQNIKRSKSESMLSVKAAPYKRWICSRRNHRVKKQIFEDTIQTVNKAGLGNLDVLQTVNKAGLGNSEYLVIFVLYTNKLVLQSCI